MTQKVSKIDYSKAMLPRTRKEQLGDCFKMNYLVLLKCGLLLLLFFVPLLVFSLFMDFYYIALMKVSVEDIEQTKTLFFYILYGGIVILAIPVILVISGITHILRNLIWGEGIYFFSDFKAGIKANAAKNMLFGFIAGVIFFVSYFVSTLFSGLFASYIPLIIFAIVFFPVYFWMVFLNNTYVDKWTGLIRSGFFFYIKNLVWSIIGILMPLSLILLLFMPFSIIWLKYILLVLFIVFVFPIIFLIMTLFTTAKFDQYINRDNYPDYYLKGLNHD